jgi:hypothetical protein
MRRIDRLGFAAQLATGNSGLPEVGKRTEGAVLRNSLDPQRSVRVFFCAIPAHGSVKLARLVALYLQSVSRTNLNWELG